MSNDWRDDWRELTEAEAGLLQSCGPDEACVLYDDELIKLPISRMMEWQGAAIMVALREAFGLAGIASPDQLADYKVDPMDADRLYVRVNVTAADGCQASAVAMLQDPRAH